MKIFHVMGLTITDIKNSVCICRCRSTINHRNLRWSCHIKTYITRISLFYTSQIQSFCKINLYAFDINRFFILFYYDGIFRCGISGQFVFFCICRDCSCFPIIKRPTLVELCPCACRRKCESNKSVNYFLHFRLIFGQKRDGTADLRHLCHPRIL